MGVIPKCRINIQKFHIFNLKKSVVIHKRAERSKQIEREEQAKGKVQETINKCKHKESKN